MIFTSRTYRVAIRRSIAMERRWLSISKSASAQPMGAWIPSYMAYLAQIAHTRRLQARKRKERK